MRPALKSALLEAGVIAGTVLAWLCIAEGTRDRVKRELTETDKVWAKAAEVVEDGASAIRD